MASAEPVTDRSRIRKWADERGGKPALVRGTQILRIDLPGDGPDESLEPIEWDEWFRILDENDLVVLLQDRKENGERSTFSKIVSRDTADASR